jgi:uncharacterized membrane protein YfcA
MTTALIFAIVFLAALLQSLSGFGFALIIMPLITLMLGLQIAAPLVALAGLAVYSINLIRYRRAIDFREVLRLAAASALGVPVGIWVLVQGNELLVKRVLGLILITYAIYVLVRPTVPRLVARGWAYPAGFLAGCLGGAYNTPGPPVIVYCSLRQWPRDEFRAVLQALFLVNALLVVASHLVAHHVTGEVLTFYLYALPALALGILAGARVDDKLNHDHFRTLVTAMILVMGVALALGLGR